MMPEIDEFEIRQMELRMAQVSDKVQAMQRRGVGDSYGDFQVVDQARLVGLKAELEYLQEKLDSVR